MAKQKKIKEQRPATSASAQHNSDQGFMNTAMVWINANAYLTLAIILLLLLLYVFKDFLFLEKVYLFKDIGSDSVNVFLPQFEHLADYLRHDGFPKWTFREGMGQNYFAFSFGDPFRLFFACIGRQNIPYAIAYAEAIKIFLAGTFFFFFLRKINLSSFASICGALLYAFSGFMMIGGAWYEFSYEGFYFAMLLFALELFMKDDRWFLIPLTIAMIAVHQPFHLVHAALLISAYLFCRSIFIQKLETKKFSIRFLSIAALGVLGILISSFLLFSNIEMMLQSPRGSGSDTFFATLSSKPVVAFTEPLQMISILMRSFSSDMLGTGNDFKGFSNYLESPMNYCGLIGFLLLPQLFIQVNKNKKIILALILILAAVPMIFPFFRYAFWLFSGDYFRAISLFEIIVFLLLSVAALHHIEKGAKINIPLLAGSLMLALVVLFFPSDLKEKIINNDLRFYSTMLLVVYGMLLLIMNSQGNAALGKMLILVFIVIELGSFSAYPFDKRKIITSSELKERTGYNDYTLDALHELSLKDSSFFRVIKDYSSGPAMHGSLNDSKMQNFRGTAGYFAFPQGNYISFLENTNVIHKGVEVEARWTSGLLTRPLLQGPASVKYILSKHPENNFTGMGYDSIFRMNDVLVYKNKFFLPLGYGVEHVISEDDFSKLSPFEKDKMLLKAIVKTDESFPASITPVAISDTGRQFTFEEFRSLADKLKEDTLHITAFSENYIKGKINFKKEKLLYFSIPFDKGWMASCDDKPLTLHHANYGFMAASLPAGEHSIELHFEPRFLKSGAIVSCMALSVYGLLLFLFRKKMNEAVTN